MFNDPVAVTAYVQNLTRLHGVSGIEFNVVKNLPYVLLKLSSGAWATISLYGGQLISWIDAKGRDVLFLSEQAEYAERKSVRGGTQIIFPWFGKIDEPERLHGFARNMFWNFESCQIDPEQSSITLSITDNEQTLCEWAHSFRLEVTYTLRDTLQITANLINTSKEHFSSQFALQNYFNTQSIHNVQIRGLESCEFIDKAKNGLNRGLETSKALKFVGLVDRVYRSVSKPVTIHGIGSYILSVESDMSDRVIWNPGKVEGAKLEDLPSLSFEKFVCVASGAVEPPISLAPGATWTAMQKIEIAR